MRLLDMLFGKRTDPRGHREAEVQAAQRDSQDTLDRVRKVLPPSRIEALDDALASEFQATESQIRAR